MEEPGRRGDRRVLHKPADFDPSKKYPLLVVIHGGPTGVSRAVPFTSTIYPIDVWVPRGVLVLEPNYRGSAGYGEKFRALNVRNLGVGDAWDVLSGVDSLIAKGIVIPRGSGRWAGARAATSRRSSPRTTPRASRRSRSAPASRTG